MEKKDIREVIEKEFNDSKKSLRFSIITLADWRENVEKVIQLIEECKEQWKEAPAIKWIKTYFHITYENGKLKELQYSPKKWESIREEIREGKVQSITIHKGCNEKTPKGRIILFFMSMNFIIPEEFAGTRKEENEISFYIHPCLMDNISTLAELPGLFKELFVLFDGIYGHMDYLDGMASIGTGVVVDSVGFESLNKIDLIYQDSRKYDHLARGYYWGNILTEKHIEALGGEEAFVANVPHHILEKLPMKDGRLAYYIQLTPNVFFFEPEKYLALKDYLKPILPPENIGYTLFVDPDGERRKRNRLVYHPEELEAAQPEADKLFAAEEERRRKWKEAGGMAQFAKPPYVRFKRRREADPSYLEITVEFETLSEEQGEQLKKLIDDWYAIGSFNGFDGPFHMQFSLWQDGTSIGTAIDAASVNGLNQALKVLERVINDFANNEGLRIKKAEIGSFEDKET